MRRTSAVYLSRRRGIAAAILMLLILIPRPGDAQVLYGSLVGNVTEQSQAAVPGADVTVVNTETNLTRHVRTNESGTYSFPNLQAGTYSVTIRMAGFADFVVQDVVVGQNSTVRRDAVLKVAGVESTSPSRRTPRWPSCRRTAARSATRSRPSSSKICPCRVAGNYQSLLQTLPGFEMEGGMRPDRMGGCNPSGSVGFSVNGTTTSTTSTNVDGATNAHIWNVGRSAIVPTLESIDGVNVVTNSFDAEQGMAGGAVINVQTKIRIQRLPRLAVRVSLQPAHESARLLPAARTGEGQVHAEPPRRNDRRPDPQETSCSSSAASAASTSARAEAASCRCRRRRRAPVISRTSAP